MNHVIQAKVTARTVKKVGGAARKQVWHVQSEERGGGLRSKKKLKVRPGSALQTRIHSLYFILHVRESPWRFLNKVVIGSDLHFKKNTPKEWRKICMTLSWARIS